MPLQSLKWGGDVSAILVNYKKDSKVKRVVERLILLMDYPYDLELFCETE